MSVEVEIKLKINSRTDIERVLEETGFVRADLVLESDTYYTSDHHDFAALDEAFRVRSTENRMTGKRSAAITYKGAKMEGFNIREISDILDMKESTVKSRLQRGRKQVAEMYQYKVREGRA